MALFPLPRSYFHTRDTCGIAREDVWDIAAQFLLNRALELPAVATLKDNSKSYHRQPANEPLDQSIRARGSALVGGVVEAASLLRLASPPTSHTTS